MKCVHCSNWIPDHAHFCQTCGKSQPAPTPPAPRNQSRALHVLQSLVMLAIAGILIALLVERNKKQTHLPEQPKVEAATPAKQDQRSQAVKNVAPSPLPQPAPAPPTPPATIEPPQPPPTAPPEMIVLIDNAVTVPPGRDFYVQFDLRKPARIIGRFVAEGGWGNDIRTVITDSDGFVNMQNHHSFRYFYDSGKQTVGNVDVTVDAGRYYLVFSNASSIISNKVVRATFRAELARGA